MPCPGHNIRSCRGGLEPVALIVKIFPRKWLHRLLPAVACVQVVAGAAELSSGLEHWAFQPIRDEAPPPVVNTGWVKSPVDQFVVAGMEAQGLAPALAAQKLALLRRVSLDLIGLPPTCEQQARFLSDSSEGAFARIVDELLAMPAYGERWGRHWLDVARYADTAGESSDYPIPQAWMYRNWVIDSFNRDQPYDSFIREQLAGDLMPAVDAEDRKRKLVATGFVALGRRFSVDPDGAMHLTIEDTLDTIGKGFMGYSFSCARCHDHKFDPISSRDYYAMYGIFSSTRYPFPGSENKPRQRDLVPLVTEEEHERSLIPLREKARPVREEIASLEALRKTWQAIRNGEKTESKPELSQNQITEKIKELRKQETAIFDRAPEIPSAFALADAKDPKDAAFQERGEPSKLKGIVPRGFPMMLGGGQLPKGMKGSGRLELAQRITRPENPLIARVMVNRVWHHHFGRGLVATPDDFGTKGQRPSHPVLLDWLAARFMEDGWSVKKLHRRMLLTATYQQSTQISAAAAEKDPDNVWLSHFTRQRLDAEAVRDAMLFASGALDRMPGRGHPFPAQGTWKFTQHAPFNDVYPSNKRSVYLMQQRIRKHPYFELFDGADPNTTTGNRDESTTALQALFMMNDGFVHEQARMLVRRALASGLESPGMVNLLYCFTLGRPASDHDTARALALVDAVERRLPEGPQRSEQAWSSLGRALLSSNEFIYLD